MLLITVAQNPEGGQFIYVIFSLIVVALALMWLILPVIVVSKFNQLIKVAKDIILHIQLAQRDLAAMRKYYEQPPEPLPPPLQPDQPAKESLANPPRYDIDLARD